MSISEWESLILEAVTAMFPRWREDIQEKFVLAVARAALSGESRPAQDAEDDELRGQSSSVLRAMVRFWQKQCAVLQAAATKEPAPASGAPEPVHTDHPLRHWSRTCPACIDEVSSGPAPALDGEAGTRDAASESQGGSQ